MRSNIPSLHTSRGGEPAPSEPVTVEEAVAELDAAAVEAAAENPEPSEGDVPPTEEPNPETPETENPGTPEPEADNPGPAPDEPNPREVRAVEDAAETAAAATLTVEQLADQLKGLQQAMEGLQRVIASGYAGRRWIPKINETREHFIDRARSGEPNFAIGEWEQAHGSELRREFPENFHGSGW